MDLTPLEPKGGPPIRLPLDTLKNARRSLARIMASFYRGQTDPEIFKGMVYGFNVLLSFLKEERSDQIEERIASLEEAIRTKEE